MLAVPPVSGTQTKSPGLGQGFFLVFGGGGGGGEVGDLAVSVPLNNFLIIKAMTMRLGG